MNIINVENKRITNTDAIIIKSYDEDIFVQGNIPTSASLELHIFGTPFAYLCPMYYDTEKEMFVCRFILTDKIYNYILKHTDIKYFFRVVANGVKLDGSASIDFKFNKMINQKKVDTHNVNKEVLRRLNLLEAKLNAFTKHNYTSGIPIGEIAGLKPGMIPVALDEHGNFRYDYPFSNLEEIVTNSVETSIAMAETISVLTQRINDLENSIYNHINAGVI